MPVRSASTFWGGAVATAVLLGSLATAPAVGALVAAPHRRVVPTPPIIHVPTDAEALTLAANLEQQAMAASPVPDIPVDHTGYSGVVLDDVNGYDTAVGYDVVRPDRHSSRELVLVHNGTSEVIGRTTGVWPMGDRSTFAKAINDNGVVVGDASCQCPRTPPGVPYDLAFRWSRHEGFTYPPLPADVKSAYATDINDNGIILVNVFSSTPSETGAWLWNSNDGSLQKLPDLGGGPATALSLNNDGTVVGFAVVAGGWRHAVRWGPGRHHHIRDLAPGPQHSMATDINQAGTIVGWEYDADSHAMAWLQNGKKARDLGSGRAYAINDDDQVAGNDILARIVPDDGLPYVDATVGMVFDLWNPARRVVLNRGPFSDDGDRTGLNDNGLVAGGGSLSGPVALP